MVNKKWLSIISGWNSNSSINSVYIKVTIFAGKYQSKNYLS